MNTYKHTHASYNDGSTAMMVSETKDTITLVNEDGYEWTDPHGQWILLGNETYDDIERWEDAQENDYPPSQSGAEFMADYYNSDSYIAYLNG